MVLSCQIYGTTRCGNHCKHCLVRNFYKGDADFSNVVRIIEELPRLFVPYLEFTGGDPMLPEWLPEGLILANRRRLYTCLTVSGPLVTKRGAEVLPLPKLVRFSIDGDRVYHEANRGPGFFQHVINGLETAQELRKGKRTQLIFTTVPGEGGNINQEILSSVLRFARSYRVLVNVNPVFSTPMSTEEVELLRWFAHQADVYMSKGKLRFICKGGNNIKRPTCRAVDSVITIAPDNRLVLPCFHHQVGSISLDNISLRDALNSPVRRETRTFQGRYEFCQGCSIWCYLVPSWISLTFTRVVAWLDNLSRFQTVRDDILHTAGSLHSDFRYPLFRPKG